MLIRYINKQLPNSLNCIIFFQNFLWDKYNSPLNQQSLATTGECNIFGNSRTNF